MKRCARSVTGIKTFRLLKGLKRVKSDNFHATPSFAMGKTFILARTTPERLFNTLYLKRTIIELMININSCMTLAAQKP